MLVATRLAAGFRDEVIISPDPRICMQRGSQCSAHIVYLDIIIPDIRSLGCAPQVGRRILSTPKQKTGCCLFDM